MGATVVLYQFQMIFTRFFIFPYLFPPLAAGCDQNLFDITDKGGEKASRLYGVLYTGDHHRAVTESGLHFNLFVLQRESLISVKIQPGLGFFVEMDWKPRGCFLLFTINSISV